MSVRIISTTPAPSFGSELHDKANEETNDASSKGRTIARAGKNTGMACHHASPRRARQVTRLRTVQ